MAEARAAGPYREAELGGLEREHGVARSVAATWLGLGIVTAVFVAFGLGSRELAVPAFGGAGLMLAFSVVVAARGLLPLPGGLRVRVHEHGLEAWRRVGGTTALRYRDVISLESSTARVAGREDVMQTHVLRDAHGAALVLTHQIGRCSELADTVRTRTFRVRLEPAQAALQRGETVRFGRVSLSPSEIRVEEKRPLSLAEVEQITLEGDVVRITRRDPTLPEPVVWTRLAHGDVPDADVLVAIVNERRAEHA